MIICIFDIVYFEEFIVYINQCVVEINVFFVFGVVVIFDQFNQFFVGQGEMFLILYWNLLIGVFNVGLMNFVFSVIVGKLIVGKQIVCRFFWNNGWFMVDLVVFVVGDDFFCSLGDFLVVYWDIQINFGVINVVCGILVDNDINDNDDMFINVVIDVVGVVGDVEKIFGNVVIDVQQMLGDCKNQVIVIGMYFVQYVIFQKFGFLVDVFDFQIGYVMYEIYLGKWVIVDDVLLAVFGINCIIYIGVLFGNGVMGLGFGDVKVLEEYDCKVV